MRVRTRRGLVPALTLACGSLSLNGCSDDVSEPSVVADAGFLPDVGFTDTGVAGGAPVDLTGTWASIRVSSQCFEGPLGDDRVLFTWISKHEITQTGETAKLTTEVCDLDLSDYRGSTSTYPAASIAAFDVLDVDVVLGGATTGSTFVSLDQVHILGWQPNADPLGEILPEEAMDPRLRDSDNDGNPGVTVSIMGQIDGDVYLASRSVVVVRGVIDDAETITGTTETDAEQIIVGATEFLLMNNSTATDQDPEPDSSPFEMARLTSDLTCAQIVADAVNLFDLTAGETPTSCP